MQIYRKQQQQQQSAQVSYRSQEMYIVDDAAVSRSGKEALSPWSTGNPLLDSRYKLNADTKMW